MIELKKLQNGEQNCSCQEVRRGGDGRKVGMTMKKQCKICWSDGNNLYPNYQCCTVVLQNVATGGKKIKISCDLSELFFITACGMKIISK